LHSPLLGAFFAVNRKKPGFPGFRSASFPSGTLRAPPIPCAFPAVADWGQQFKVSKIHIFFLFFLYEET
jgi:hypothetical protein